MDIFMLKKVMKEADTPYKLIKIDLEDNTKQKPIINVKLLTSVVGMVANEQKEAIKKNFVKLLKKMVAKMQERCPLKYALVRNASSLSPVNMARGEGYSNLFGKLVNQLHLHNRFSANVSDAAKEQYDWFLEEEVEKNVDKFKKFDIKSQRLDEFLGTYMVGEPKYKELCQVCKFVFVLSHGQAPVERGFNINKDTEVENLHEESLVSLRLVYDEILARGDDITTMEISPELSLSCKQASSKYREHLAKKNEDVQKKAIGEKRKLLQEEHAKVKRIKMDEQSIIESLKKNVDKYIGLAAKAAMENNNVEMKTIVVKANSFKETIEQKKKTVADLEMALEKLNEDIDKCK